MDYLGLLYISAGAGLFVLVGNLYLISKGRVLIDTEGKTVEEISLPFGFRVKTQRPFVVMFLFGIFLVAMPLFMVRNRLDSPPEVLVTGKIEPKELNDHFGAFATVDSNDNVINEIKLSVPFLQNPRYRIVYYDDRGVLSSEYLDWKKVINGQYQLTGFQVANSKPKCDFTKPSTQAAAPLNPADVVRESPEKVQIYR